MKYCASKAVVLDVLQKYKHQMPVQHSKICWQRQHIFMFIHNYKLTVSNGWNSLCSLRSQKKIKNTSYFPYSDLSVRVLGLGTSSHNMHLLPAFLMVKCTIHKEDPDLNSLHKVITWTSQHKVDFSKQTELLFTFKQYMSLFQNKIRPKQFDPQATGCTSLFSILLTLNLHDKIILIVLLPLLYHHL
jgi:hypothetical protein